MTSPCKGNISCKEYRRWWKKGAEPKDAIVFYGCQFGIAFYPNEGRDGLFTIISEDDSNRWHERHEEKSSILWLADLTGIAYQVQAMLKLNKNKKGSIG